MAEDKFTIDQEEDEDDFSLDNSIKRMSCDADAILDSIRNEVLYTPENRRAVVSDDNSLRSETDDDSLLKGSKIEVEFPDHSDGDSFEYMSKSSKQSVDDYDDELRDELKRLGNVTKELRDDLTFEISAKTGMPHTSERSEDDEQLKNEAHRFGNASKEPREASKSDAPESSARRNNNKEEKLKGEPTRLGKEPRAGLAAPETSARSDNESELKDMQTRSENVPEGAREDVAKATERRVGPVLSFIHRYKLYGPGVGGEKINLPLLFATILVWSGVVVLALHTKYSELGSDGKLQLLPFSIKG